MASATFTPLIFLTALSSLLLLPRSFAWTPVPYSNVAYATTFDQSTLYVQGGGSSGSTGQSQFFMLDLTGSGWSTASPPFTPLPTGRGINPAPAASSHSMAVSPDGKKLTFWVQRQGVVFYDLLWADWTGMIDFPQSYNNSIYSKEVLQSATDPSTGLIHLPSGAEKGTKMYVYDPSSRTGEAYLMPPSSVIDGPVSGYVFQWCASRNSMLLHGGTNMNLLGDARPREYTNPYLIEYNPREHTWTRLETTGPSPGGIMYHCMAAAYNGTKMVVFGGESLQGSQSVEGGPRGAIYILDVPSLTWKRGPDVDPIHNRSAMACAAAGDSFVAWGGKSKTDTLNSTIIFNIDDSVWTDKFRQRQASKGNGAIIGGAAAAALVIVCASIVIYHCRMRNKKNDQHSTDKNSTADSEHLLVSDDKDRNPQTITLRALRYADGPRSPEYIALRLGEDQFYRQHNPSVENNPQFVPRVQYQGLPTSDPQLVIPRDPQFRLEPQADLNALLRLPQAYSGFPGTVVVGPQAQQLQAQAQAQAFAREQAAAYAQMQARMQEGVRLGPQQQQQLPLLPQQQRRYWQELERLRIEYQRLDASANAGARM